MSAEDAVRKALQDASRPADPSDGAWNAIESTATSDRPDVTQSRKPSRVALVAALVAVVLIGTSIVVVARRDNTDRGDSVDVGGTAPPDPSPRAMLPWATGTTMVLDDGTGSVIAVDLDTAAAVRVALPGGGPGDEPIRLAVVGDRLVYPGDGHIHAIDLDLVSHPADLGAGVEFFPMADRNDAIIRVSSDPPTEFFPSGSFRWQEVSLDGTAEPGSAGEGKKSSDEQPPKIGYPDGVLAAFSDGVLMASNGVVSGVSSAGSGGVNVNWTAVLGRMSTNAAGCANPTAHGRLLAFLAAQTLASTTCDTLTIADPARGMSSGARHPSGQPATLAFSNDGNQLAVAPKPTADGTPPADGLQIIDTNTDQQARAFAGGVAWRDQLEWSADNSTVLSTAVLGNPNDRRLVLTAAQTTSGLETSVPLPLDRTTSHAVAIPSPAGPKLDQATLPPCPTSTTPAADIGSKPAVTTQPCRLQASPGASVSTTPPTSTISSVSPSSTTRLGSTTPSEPSPGTVEPPSAGLPVEWDLDAPTGPTSTSIGITTRYRGCAGFNVPGDRLHLPTVTETPTSITITFTADPYPGSGGLQTCPRPSGTPATVQLSEPVGNRSIYDGSTNPPTKKYPS